MCIIHGSFLRQQFHATLHTLSLYRCEGFIETSMSSQCLSHVEWSAVCSILCSPCTPGVFHSCQGQSHSECSCSHVVVMSSSSDQQTSILHSFLGWAAMNLFILVTQHAGSCFPDQGMNPCPLQWTYGVLSTGPPEKSQSSEILSNAFILSSWKGL